MNIKLIGADSSNGIKILKNISKAQREVDIDLNVEKIFSSEKDKYGIKVTPALMINNEIVSEGNVISDREITKIIKSYC